MTYLRLKAEIWETQVWIMWVLALMLYETHHMALFYVVLAWSITSFIGTLIMLTKARLLEEGKIKNHG